MPIEEIKTLKEVCYIYSFERNILSIGQIIEFENFCIFDLKQYVIILAHKLH